MNQRHRATFNAAHMMFRQPGHLKIIDGRLTAEHHGQPSYAIDLDDGYEIRGGRADCPKRNWSWAQQRVNYIERPATVVYDERRDLSMFGRNPIAVQTLNEVLEALEQLNITQVRIGDGDLGRQIARAIVDSKKTPDIVLVGTNCAQQEQIVLILRDNAILEITHGDDGEQADLYALEESAFEAARDEAAESNSTYGQIAADL